MYFTCPVCGNNYKGHVPKGGDGTGWLLPKHFRKVYANPYSKKREPCPGSYRLMEIEESKDE